MEESNLARNRTCPQSKKIRKSLAPTKKLWKLYQLMRAGLWKKLRRNEIELNLANINTKVNKQWTQI